MNRAMFILLAIAAVGCNRAAESDGVNTSTNTFRGTSADNTGKNERDRDMQTLTPGDQGGSEGDVDRKITQLVRKGVVEEYGALTAAANVKIITVDRVVTLRGPVDSQSEQSTIETIARRVDRVVRVDNQLEVASK